MSLMRILWYWVRGVRFVSIKGVYIGKNVWIMPGAVIYPNTYIDGYSFVGSGAVVLPNARIVDSVILPGGQIGCEITRSVTGYNTNSKHQGTYIGDAVIGNSCNIGAGTVFCNYDGYKKHTTVLEDNVFIGSGNMIIAPRTIGKNSSTGAGSVLTKDIPKEEIWVGSPARKKEQ